MHGTRLWFKILFFSTLICSPKAWAQSDVLFSKNPCQTDLVTLNSRSSGALTADELLGTTQLLVKPPCDTLFTIKSFRFTLVRTGGKPAEVQNNYDGTITGEMYELIKTAVAGDKIYFEYLKLRDYKGSTRSHGALSFTVK